MLILSELQIPEWAIQVLVFAIIFGGWIIRAIAKAYNNYLEKKQQQQQYQDRLRAGQATKAPDPPRAGARRPTQQSQRGTAPPVPQRPVPTHPPRRPATGQRPARPVPPPRPIQWPHRPTPPTPPVPDRRPAEKPPAPSHLQHVPHMPERPAAKLESPVQLDLPRSPRPVVVSTEQAKKIQRRFDNQARQLKALQSQVSKQRTTIDQLSNDLQAVSEIQPQEMLPTPSSLRSQFTPRALRRVILLNEIIGQPVSLRDPLQF